MLSLVALLGGALPADGLARPVLRVGEPPDSERPLVVEAELLRRAVQSRLRGQRRRNARLEGRAETTTIQRLFQRENCGWQDLKASNASVPLTALRLQRRLRGEQRGPCGGHAAQSELAIWTDAPESPQSKNIK